MANLGVRVVLCLVLGALARSTAAKENSERDTGTISEQLADATTTFSLNLFKEILDKTPGNVIISPVSVSSLLAILQEGALNNSRKQLLQLLHADPEQLRLGFNKLIASLAKATDNATLEFANGAFLMERFEILQEFKQIIIHDFLSHIDSVDFSKSKQAADIINSWVAKHTHDRIRTLISPEQLPSDTRLILTNAIYFKSLWKTPFITKNTRDETFHTQDGAEIQVPTMHLDISLRMDISESLKSQWVEIPFGDEQFSLLVIVPYGQYGLGDLLKKLTVEQLSDIINNLKTAYEDKIHLSLPKFKLSTKSSLIPALRKLGLRDVFNSKSNLRGISRERLKVSMMIQKAEIEVDEKGVTASAATGIRLVPISAPFEFRVNRPFLAFIIDKKNLIPLFAGRITDPSI